MNTLIDEIGHQLYLYRVKCDMALSDRDEGIISQEEYAQAIERQKEINTNAIKSELLQAILEVIGENEYGNIGYDGEDMVDETTEEMLYRNQLRQELKTKFKELFNEE